MEMVERASLTSLRFAHRGGESDVEAEVARLRRAERAGEVDYNYVLYAGRKPRGAAADVPGSRLFLNPALRSVVAGWRLFPLTVDSRLGFENPPLDRATRTFLRRFREPVAVERLGKDDLTRAEPLVAAAFLIYVR